MRSAFIGIATLLLLTSTLSLRPAHAMPDTKETVSDSELFGKAIEYFQSGKFHEALLNFDKLDGRYKLNPRFRAFMAVCYYYDWNDEKTCEYLDSLIPQLEPFAPHERSIYYYVNAESHFNLKQYDQALDYYEKVLSVCYNNEKPDAFYRMGYCHLFNNDTVKAFDYFNSALDYYRLYRNTEKDAPRIAQIERIVGSMQPDMKAFYAEEQMSRDTLRGRIINDIDLSDIFEQQIIVVEE